MPTNIDYNVSWLVIPESWKCQPPVSEPATEKPTREPPQWRLMTDLEIEAARHLGRCRLPPATSTKRLAGHLAAQASQENPKITDKQAVYLWKFCWTFRRQIESAAVRKEAKRRKAEA